MDLWRLWMAVSLSSSSRVSVSTSDSRPGSAPITDLPWLLVEPSATLSFWPRKSMSSTVYGRSSSVTSETARPDWPARAVRPERWTKSLLLGGKS